MKKQNPIPKNERERLAALRNYAILDSPGEAEFDRITKLASLICDVPISLISLMDENRLWYKSRVGLEQKEVQRDLSLCQYIIADSNYLEIEDISTDKRFTGDDMFANYADLRFYAGCPLIDPDGYALGALCIADNKARKLTDSQKRSMFLLAQEVISLIVERRKKQELGQFEKLFNLSNDLICITDSDGLFKKINPAFERVLGWDTESFMHATIFDLVHPEDHEDTQLQLLRLAAGQHTINFNSRCKTRNNIYKTLQWTVVPELSTGFLFAIARDVTEEKLKEQQLAASEKKLSAFFENSQGLMCTHDLKGKFLSFSSSGAALLGYTREEMLELSLFDIVQEGKRDDLNDYLNLLQEIGYARGEIVLKNRDNSTRLWTFNNVLVSDNNDLSTVVCNAIDINDRYNLVTSRKLMDDILQAASEVSIIATDLSGRITVFNSGAEKLLGYTAQEIIGKQSVHIFHLPEEMVQLAKEFPELRDTDPNSFEVISKQFDYTDFALRDFTYVRKDGTHRLVSLVGTPIRDTKNKITGYLGIATDITERKEIENSLHREKIRLSDNVSAMILQSEELKAAKQLAEQASIAKSEFLANMSHEIRTPLNGVIGFTDLVLKTHLNETQSQYLSIVNQSANTLLGIINDILDFSKIEAGKLELDVQKFDLYEMACQATDIITYTIQSKGLEMLLNISSDLPRFIWSDAIRLKQILINLLGNAAKFTEKGEVELKIEVLASEGGQTMLRFGVRDTGIGIKHDRQWKIFEAFSQEDGSITKKYGGTGLGLTISNKLLGLMGSQLELKSRPGAGSFFYFDLSLKSEPGEAIEWGDIDLIKKVLVVDDNENNRIIISQMLLLKNIKCVEATNGFEVLKRIAAGEHYDVILMDYHMPYMDGLDTIRRIRENFYPTAEEQPIVLLFSSAEDEKIIKACEELEVYHRLVKPVKIQDVYNSLSRIYKKKNNVPAIPLITNRENTKANSVTILLAEDNMVNMLLAKTVIRRIIPHAFLLEAVNGREALEYCEAKFPDLILMDIQMPDMNGYEATMRIRALERMGHVPIIALTAGNLTSDRDRCLDAGMDDIITKPFVEETIATMLNQWLHSNGKDSDSKRDIVK